MSEPGVDLCGWRQCGSQTARKPTTLALANGNFFWHTGQLMKLVFACREWPLFFAMLALGTSRGGATHLIPSLSPAQIMSKAIERAQQLESDRGRPDYVYTKLSITEELDDKGRVKDRKQKRYQVLFHSGLSYLKLMKVEGQNLSAAELRKQQDHELAERQKLTQTKFAKGGDNRENFLTPELVAKYRFTLIGSECVHGRPTYELKFEPKAPDLPVKQMIDRLLNHLSGTVWIDEEEFEIAKAEAHLDSEVTLWGGVLASLKRVTLCLERTRIDDGVWFNRATTGDFEGRRLLDPTRIRIKSESNNFRKLGSSMD